MDTDVISNTPDLNSSASASAPGESSNMWKYIIIILILALLGFNIFRYLGFFSKVMGNLLDYILAFFKPIFVYFGYGVSETAKTTVDLTAAGSTKVINTAAGTVTGGINMLQQGLGKNAQRSGQMSGQMPQGPGPGQPLPDEAGSTTQASKAQRKAGFCYIGEDRGFRSCISVGERDTCMSGDIFPSQALCINPNLRSG
jgi:hypothetical protein